MLDPGRGRTSCRRRVFDTTTGYHRALARDDRNWGGADPAGVVFFYAPDRSGGIAETVLRGVDRILQPDGYTGDTRLTRPSRKGGDPIRVARCWAHARRKLREMFDRDGVVPEARLRRDDRSRSPLCLNRRPLGSNQWRRNGRPHQWLALRRIAELDKAEAGIRGCAPGQRLSARQARTAPLVVAVGDWLQDQRLRVSAKSRLGEKPAHIHRHRDGLWDGLSGLSP